MAIFERAEQIRDIRMIDRFARIILDQILFRYIGNVIILIVFGQQVIERLFLGRAAVLGDGRIPFVRVAEFGIHVKNHTPKRVFAVADHLSQMIFGSRLQHVLQPLAPTTSVKSRRLSNFYMIFKGNSL